MTPVIFLHGIGVSARMFAPQVASFASAGYQPVALDLPGYGDRTPVEAMSFEALAEDVEFTITQNALEKPVLIGHSMGGMVVQTMLRRRPDDYRAAVLSCTSPAFGNPAGDFQKKFVADRLAPLEAGRTMADIAPDAAAGLMGPNADPAGKALFIEQYALTPESTYRAAVQCLVTFDERANLPDDQGPGAVPRRRARPQCAAACSGKDGRENPGRALCLSARARPHAEPRSTTGF